MSEKIEKARVLADLGRYDGAREMLAEVLASEPEHAAALADMANLAYRVGEYERALEFAASALRVTPDDVFVWRVRALSELQLARAADGEAVVERRERAVSAARRAVELDPGNVDSVRILAATQRDTDPAAALANLDQALELDPDNVHVHLLRGLTLRRNVQGPEAPAQAEAAFREVLRLEPENTEALYELALLTVDQGDREAGATQLRRVAQLDPAYGDVVREQLEWLAKQDALRAQAAREAATARVRSRYGGAAAGAPLPVPPPAPGAPQPAQKPGGGRFGRWAAGFVVLMVIRGLIAAGSHHDSTPATHYTPPSAVPSYWQRPITIQPLPSFAWPSDIPRPPYQLRTPAPTAPR
ncbi:tetratricopeptide repeat protein [Nocardia niigatensis]